MAGTYSITPTPPANGPEIAVAVSGYTGRGQVKVSISNVVLDDEKLTFSYSASLWLQNYYDRGNHYIESKLDGNTDVARALKTVVPQTYYPGGDTWFDTNIRISGKSVTIARSDTDTTHTLYVSAGTTGGYNVSEYNSPITFTIVVPALEKKGASVSVKVDGVWKQAKTFVKVNGVWKEGEVSVYSGGWKQ